MGAVRYKVIDTGLRALRMSGLHRIAAPWTRGAGAILTFHRVTESSGGAFSPNRPLEVAPSFLDKLLTHLRGAGYRVVRLDEVLPLLRSPTSQQSFVALTFDDGYRDTLTAALPVLERHQAPFTVFATTGLLDRTARLWWIELERALACLTAAELEIEGLPRRIPADTAREKQLAFAAITGGLLTGSDDDRLNAIGELCRRAGISTHALVDELCMDWRELTRLADHPLATVGCHTLTHPRLSRLSGPRLRDELSRSRTILEGRLGVPVRHVCYPYGGAAAAGPREFGMAAALGYATGVTTRPGVLQCADASTPTALPRISVNGQWQTLGAIDVLLSGLGFMLWNRARLPRINAATVPPGRPAPST